MPRWPAAPSTTIFTATTGPLCVSGGCLHPARPTVAALWPECVDMAVGTQQLVRMRAVVEPGGGGDTVAAAASMNAHPKRSMTHYGTQLARLACNVWRLEGTRGLLRELRLGDGDRVELVPLEGGVVGVRRAGPEEAWAGHSAAHRDKAAAAEQQHTECGASGGWTGSAGRDSAEGREGLGLDTAASGHAAWLNGW